MKLRTHGLAALVTALLAANSFAQTSFPEVEPNSNKAEADANGTITMTAGDSITGTSTGTTTTALSTLVTSVDQFRVKTALLPVGIYKHTLTLSSTTAGHTGTIRGLNQTGTGGTASTGGTPGTVDTTIQTSSTTTVNPPPRSNVWYGFGKQEELYYRVTGTTTTTDAYAATLSTSTVPFTVLPQAFESSSPITLQTVGQTTADTAIALYDSALNSIPGALNDDEGPAGSTLQSRLIRSLAPGTYYLAVSRFQLAWNHAAAPDEDHPTEILMDFPNVLVTSSSTPTTGTDDRDFQVVAANGIWNQSNQVASPDSFSVQWFQFTVAAGAPPIINPPPANDNCASATALAAAGGTITGDMLGATNDGTASCDPGGAASRDVWYSWTNTAASVRLLTVSTCGTTGLNDTVLSVLSACGGTELGCNDDNGACAAQPLSSLVSSVLVNVGQTVLVRVSDKGLGGTTNSFTLLTTINALPPPNDSCTTPIVLPGPGVYPFDTTGATTNPAEGQTTPTGCSSSVKKDVWFTYTPAVSGSVTISTCGQINPASTSQDTKVAVYLGTGCPAGAGFACNDDTTAALCPTPGSTLNSILTFSVTCGQVITIQLGNFGTTTNIFGTFTVTETGTPCSTPSTAFCTGDVVGVDCLGCGNNGAAGRGCANSSFASGALLVNGGVSSVSADTMTLTASDIPGPGLFFQANGTASINPFGDGMLCAAVGIIRMGVVFPTAGSATYPGGLTPNPISIAGAPIAAGDLKHYQCWYRDAVVFCTAQTYNTTNGVSLTWVP